MPTLNVQKFTEALHQAHHELDVAIEGVMDKVNAGKAFGDEWQTAVARERLSRSLTSFNQPTRTFY